MTFTKEVDIVVKTRVGEYFGLYDPTERIAELWDDLPEDAVIKVNKYDPRLGTGKPTVELITKKFLRGSLELIKEQMASKEIVLNLFSEEYFMDAKVNGKVDGSEKEAAERTSTSQNLINAAKTGDPKAVEEAIFAEVGRAIHRALWVAEKQDEFLAIPVLQDLKVKYGGEKVKVDTSVTAKDGKVVKLAKSEKVDDRVWSAILKKAGKVGAVTKSTGNRAECIIFKAEADTFIKAVKAVAGITVELA